MKRLLLLRHAKSSWDHDLTDQARPLNARGERAAHLMGVYVKQAGLVPDLILCSSAERTRQTASLMLKAVGCEVPVQHHDSLYLAAAEDIMEALLAVPDDVKSVMVIGHNPGMEDAALGFSVDDGANIRADMTGKYPTGGLAVIDFDASKWKKIKKGALVDYKTPKTLV